MGCRCCDFADDDEDYLTSPTVSSIALTPDMGHEQSSHTIENIATKPVTSQPIEGEKNA